MSYPVWTLLQASSVGKQTPKKEGGENESGGGDICGGGAGGGYVGVLHVGSKEVVW
jgi:hypothetical protein